MTWLLGPTGQVWRTCEFDFPGDCFDMYLESINQTRDFLPNDHENLIIFLFIDIFYAVIRFSLIVLNKSSNFFPFMLWVFNLFFKIHYNMKTHACECVAKINQLNYSLTKVSIVVNGPAWLPGCPPLQSQNTCRLYIR